MRSELLPVTEILSQKYDISIYVTSAIGDATERVKRIDEKEFDLIVVCGGDGTLNEVVTGLMITKKQMNVGYIPAGTLNELSGSLGISRIITTAAKDILNGKVTTLDIGKFEDRYFSYTASFGAFTDASYSANQDIKNALGQAAYFFEGIKSLGNIKPLRLKFEADDKIYEGDYIFGAISNSMSIGGIVKFQKANVTLNDGLFEVMLVKNPQTFAEFQIIVDGILKRELNREGIEFFHTSRITVEGSEDIPWTLDGEYCQGNKKIVIENLHSALHLIVPDCGDKPE